MDANWGQQQTNCPPAENDGSSIQQASYEMDGQHYQHYQQQQQQQVPQKAHANATVLPQPARAKAHQTPSHAGASGLAAIPAMSTPRPVRRRMRMITSCLECRRRKLKCDKNQPCNGCSKLGRECVYLGPQLDEASQLRLTALKDKVGSLEKQLELGISRNAQQQQQQEQKQHAILADEVADEDDAGEGLRVTDMVAGDVTYEDDGVDDDIVDLGVRVGKMRITDRVGGMSRPRISEEVSLYNSATTPFPSCLNFPLPMDTPFPLPT